MHEPLTESEFKALREKVAKLTRQGEEAERQRETIEAWLRCAINNNRKERSFIIREYRNAMREHRKALQQQRQQRREQQRAEKLSRLSPEALAKLKASIADVKESTKEELQAETVLAQRKEKQERREWRRWRNGNGASE
jgi:hypothetical protein